MSEIPLLPVVAVFCVAVGYLIGSVRKLLVYERILERNHELERLLLEWRRTPFFPTESAWEEWVGEFGRRVDRALHRAEGSDGA